MMTLPKKDLISFGTEMSDWMKQWDCCSQGITSEHIQKELGTLFGENSPELTVISQKEFLEKGTTCVNLCLFYGFFQFVTNFTVERVWYQVTCQLTRKFILFSLAFQFLH
jgi:hypothetical protein